MFNSRSFIAVAALAVLPIVGASATARADNHHDNDRRFGGRCDVIIVDDDGDIIRTDRKSQGSRIDDFRCDDGLWRYTTSGFGHNRGDVFAAVLIRER
ncbi:hypothetical protein [Rhodococcus chondri]|uniref:Secreted protein n=1 Tax=Rhodococcus chondri TaxID=3065941 RepID=A0ABU7JTR1_9NOCA|nr:hypothetical protein [Rhodococcus sp. CC-R104]MEE2033220.1 hypothetical protein [Rhodococcus sp. CC-R104]